MPQKQSSDKNSIRDDSLIPAVQGSAVMAPIYDSDANLSEMADGSAPGSSGLSTLTTINGTVQRLTFKIDNQALDPKAKIARKLSRNESEKLRRDKLNCYIGELARTVPLINDTDKKIDKASILRLTVTYFRIHYDLLKKTKDNLSDRWKADLKMFKNLGSQLLNAIGGFMLVINKKGVLIFATEAFTKHLGHRLTDVLGFNVFNIVHPKDISTLMQQFEPTEHDGPMNTSGSSSSDPIVGGHRSFYMKMLNVLDQQATRYEIVHVLAFLRRRVTSAGDLLTAASSSGSGVKERASDTCLIGVGKLVCHEPISELYPVLDQSDNQWITRHALDGSITYSDQRGALLTGFMPNESIGFSPYSLLHQDDIGDMATIHNIYLTTRDLPWTVFRMYTKSREIIYVRNNTHMVLDNWTRKPRFIININTVIKEDEGEQHLREQRLRVQAFRAASEVLKADSIFDQSQPSVESSISCDPESISSFASSETVVPSVEIMDDSVSVVVGMKKFRIDLSLGEKYQPKEGKKSRLPMDPSNVDALFDCGDMDDNREARTRGKGTQGVVPTFLGDEISDESDRSPAGILSNDAYSRCSSFSSRKCSISQHSNDSIKLSNGSAVSGTIVLGNGIPGNRVHGNGVSSNCFLGNGVHGNGVPGNGLKNKIINGRVFPANGRIRSLDSDISNRSSLDSIDERDSMASSCTSKQEQHSAVGGSNYLEHRQINKCGTSANQVQDGDVGVLKKLLAAGVGSRYPSSRNMIGNNGKNGFTVPDGDQTGSYPNSSRLSLQTSHQQPMISPHERAIQGLSVIPSYQPSVPSVTGAERQQSVPSRKRSWLDSEATPVGEFSPDDEMILEQFVDDNTAGMFAQNISNDNDCNFESSSSNYGVNHNRFPQGERDRVIYRKGNIEEFSKQFVRLGADNAIRLVSHCIDDKPLIYTVTDEDLTNETLGMMNKTLEPVSDSLDHQTCKVSNQTYGNGLTNRSGTLSGGNFPLSSFMDNSSTRCDGSLNDLDLKRVANGRELQNKGMNDGSFDTLNGFGPETKDHSMVYQNHNSTSSHNALLVNNGIAVNNFNLKRNSLISDSCISNSAVSDRGVNLLENYRRYDPRCISSSLRAPKGNDGYVGNRFDSERFPEGQFDFKLPTTTNISGSSQPYSGWTTGDLNSYQLPLSNGDHSSSFTCSRNSTKPADNSQIDSSGRGFVRHPNNTDYNCIAPTRISGDVNVARKYVNVTDISTLQTVSSSVNCVDSIPSSFGGPSLIDIASFNTSATDCAENDIFELDSFINDNLKDLSADFDLLEDFDSL